MGRGGRVSPADTAPCVLKMPGGALPAGEEKRAAPAEAQQSEVEKCPAEAEGSTKSKIMEKTLDKQTLMRYNTQAVRERTPQLKKFEKT